uniref:helix-turn-helix domain-containing protein n=1 Tax=Celeribacter sp. SCSIO 80788 TaxID=3117013 RepID=UPI003DA3D54C
MREEITVQTFTHVEAFNAGIRSVCGAYQVEAQSGRFAASAGLARRGGLEVATVSLTAQQVRRDARAIRRDDADHFVLVMQQRGEAVMQQGERSVTLRTGDMFLSDATQPSVFDLTRGYADQLSIHLPRDEVVSRFGAQARGGLSIRREDSLAIAMTALLQRAQEDTPPELAEVFLSLVGTWLRDIGRGEAPRAVARDGTGEGLLGRALSLINLNYRDPDFGPGALADLLDVSSRRLQRAFGPLGETPRERILATRLDQAHRALERRGARTVSDVAFDQGFGDLSHFYHSFRSRFGHAPGSTGGSAPEDGDA